MHSSNGYACAGQPCSMSSLCITSEQPSAARHKRQHTQLVSVRTLRSRRFLRRQLRVQVVSPSRSDAASKVVHQGSQPDQPASKKLCASSFVASLLCHAEPPAAESTLSPCDDIRAAPDLHEDGHVGASYMPSSLSSAAKRRRVNDIVAQSRHVAYYSASPAHAIRRLLL